MTPVDKIHTDRLAVAPWLLLPYDSITHILGLSAGATSETLPATALFSVIYLLLRGKNLRISDESRHLFELLIRCFTVVVVATAVNLAVEQFGGFRADFPSLRFITATRQGVSFSLGLSSFLMFQDSLLRLRVRECMLAVLLGMVPEFIAVTYQIVHHDYRVSGFSPEPADLGDLLVFAFFPACVIAGLAMRSRVLALIAGIGALLRAFSGTALMEGLFVSGTYFWMKRKWILGAIFVCAFSTGIYIFFRLFPKNYVLSLLSYIVFNFRRFGHLASGSLVDRLYGLLGPLLLLRTPHAWLGFGFGGDTVYFYRLFPIAIARIIRATKPGFLSISSLQGKMLLYGGVIGYAYYLRAWWTAWKSGRGNIVARVMLLGAFVTSMFSLAPFFVPYVWLWMAVSATWKSGGSGSSDRFSEPISGRIC